MSILPTPKVCANPGRPLDSLKDLFNKSVLVWLDPKVKDLLLDYLIIKQLFLEYGIGESSLSDFSYLITPAFKALEGTLLQIATELQLDPEKFNYKLGVIFDEQRLEKLYEAVFDKLESVTEDQKLDAKQWLSNAKRILSHMRHTPAHFMGEPKKTHNMAFKTGDMICYTIDEMCRSLISSGLLKPSMPAVLAEIFPVTGPLR